MKILVLSNNANGMYLFRKEALLSFKNMGYETVVSLPPDDYCDKIRALGFKVIPTRMERRGSNPVHDIKLFMEYIKLIKKEKPDIVLTYTIKPNLYGGLACRIKKIPYIMNVTGLGTALTNPSVMSKILLKFYQIAASKAACVFFQNEGNRQFMADNNVALNNSRLLPGSGVNLNEHKLMPYPDESGGIIFLAGLRIMKDKGITEYLDAAQKICGECEGAHFYLAGEYEEETRNIYEPRINELSGRGVIKYLGHVDNINEVMAGSHVIVHPSYHEGMSNVLLEAAACGRPVLASDVPGCRETMQQGLSGLLFKPKDADGLAGAIKTMLSYTESDRKEMGLRGREYMEHMFDREKVVRAYLEEIEKVMKYGKTKI